LRGEYTDTFALYLFGSADGNMNFLRAGCNLMSFISLSRDGWQGATCFENAQL